MSSAAQTRGVLKNMGPLRSSVTTRVGSGDLRLVPARPPQWPLVGSQQFFQYNPMQSRASARNLSFLMPIQCSWNEKTVISCEEKSGRMTNETGDIQPEVVKIYSDDLKGRVPTNSVRIQRLNEIAGSIHQVPGETADQYEARIARALELYESLNPKDGAESMLAIQMVATHSTILHLQRQASAPSASPQQKDLHLKQGHKLMQLYLRQLAAMDKRRGRGHQKVTVEHVTVQDGGKAIVGNIEARQFAPSIEAPRTPPVRVRRPPIDT